MNPYQGLDMSEKLTVLVVFGGIWLLLWALRRIGDK